jgi:GxxExxY protein
MMEELRLRNIKFVSEMDIQVIYKNLKMKSDFGCDLFVEDLIVVELKSTLVHHPIYEAKLLNYMNLIKSPKGILINFNCFNIFKEGQKTFVNEYYKKLPYS